MPVIEAPLVVESSSDLQRQHDELMRKVTGELETGLLDRETWRKLLKLEARARLRRSVDDPAFALCVVREIPGLAGTCGAVAIPYLERLVSPEFDPRVQRQAQLTRADMERWLRRRNEVVDVDLELAMEGGAVDVVQDLVGNEGVVTRSATLEWRDGEYAICRFEHPQKEKYGTVEREFKLAELPEGIQDGDSFTVEMELDRSGRPVSYEPVKTSLHKRVRDPREPVRPELPDNLADKAEVAAYIEKLDAFTRAEFEWVKSQP